MYSGLRMLLLEGECISPTLDRNEKVEQHIRKKTRKPNALRFWVKGGVIPLYVGSCLILEVSPLRFSQQKQLRKDNDRLSQYHWLM